MATTTETAVRSVSSPELGFDAGLVRRNAVRCVKRSPGCSDFSTHRYTYRGASMKRLAPPTPIPPAGPAGTLTDDTVAGALGLCAVVFVTLLYVLRITAALLTTFSPLARRRVGGGRKVAVADGAAVRTQRTQRTQRGGSRIPSACCANGCDQTSPLYNRPSLRGIAEKKAGAAAAPVAAAASFWSWALPVGFMLATGARLCHAWGVFARFGGVWPAGGVPEYIDQANVQQNLVTVHVAAATLWSVLLAVQMATGGGGGGTSPRRRRLHKTLGYTGLVAAAVTAVTGRLAINTLRIPSTSLVFIATQLRFGAPAFFVEAVLGVIAVARDKNLAKHKQHMRLAMFGTLADAGTGFSIAVSRALFAGSPHQIWAQDVGVLTLNFLSILPFVLPGIGPHTDHVLARDWRKVIRNPRAEFGLWDYAAVVTTVGSFALLASNAIGLWLLFQPR